MRLNRSRGPYHKGDRITQEYNFKGGNVVASAIYKRKGAAKSAFFNDW